MFLPVNNEEFNDSILTVLKCEPVMEYQEGESEKPAMQQEQRKTGLPLWLVTVSVEHESDFEPENCGIKIASKTDPGITAGPIRFGGLVFRSWNMNGKKGLSITADTWTQEPRPSSKRPPAPAPEGSPGEAKKAA